MNNFRNVWREALSMMTPVFKRLWPWLLFSQSVALIASVFMDGLKKESENVVIGGAAAVVIVQLILAVFGMIIVNQVMDDVRSKKPHSEILLSLRENIKYIFINYARALLKILVGFLLLVIPGVIFWVQLTFVPYVVMFDPAYKAGSVDALERSRSLVKGRFWRITGILILCMVLSIVPEFWLGSTKPLESPVIFIVIFLAGMILELYGDTVIYCLYRKVQEPL